MEYIIDFSHYQTYHIEDPSLSFIKDKLYESRGIPNILKSVSNELFNIITNGVNNYVYDYSYENFNVSGTINISSSDFSTIYAVSKFGIFYNGKMKQTSIDIKLPNNYDHSDLKRVILHELLHIYEVYNRIKSGSKTDLQWRLSNELMKIRGNYKDRFIQDLTYMIYLSLDHEINSRVAEVYSILMDKKSFNKDELFFELEKTSAWIYSTKLENFNFRNYEVDYDALIDFLIKLNTKIKNTNFNVFIIPESKADCNKILKHWQYIFKKASKKLKNKLKKVVNEVINDVKMIESIRETHEGISNMNKDLVRMSKIYKLER